MPCRFKDAACHQLKDVQKCNPTVDPMAALFICDEYERMQAERLCNVRVLRGLTKFIPRACHQARGLANAAAHHDTLSARTRLRSPAWMRLRLERASLAHLCALAALRPTFLRGLRLLPALGLVLVYSFSTVSSPDNPYKKLGHDRREMCNDGARASGRPRGRGLLGITRDY